MNYLEKKLTSLDPEIVPLQFRVVCERVHIELTSYFYELPTKFHENPSSQDGVICFEPERDKEIP